MDRTSRLIALLFCSGCLSSGDAPDSRADAGSDLPDRPAVGTTTTAATTSTTGKKPAWNVDQPPGPTFEAKIDTDEGTWISLDVSPDGKEIAFDLLGDIYVMPIEGGEAKAITSGISWDMQPRFSPDGRWIAFTSDRGGGDNIWTMHRDGSDLVQVSKEKEQPVNSPVWTPDGRFIAVRKHFTSARSLGAGEIWLYHRSGGKGLKMTKRPNDQKDLGEPAFSPNGRYLYFSQDVTPGKVFEYNKNPHGQIYAINRFERESGRIDRYIFGPGGAVRPTPSPDGKTIAFVRRKGLSTALLLHDIESSTEHAIYQNLDRDLQETWAVHGVYPAFAWTPDSRSLVFWAGGKIRRHRLHTGKTEVIPFRAKGSRTMLEALRYPVQVHPEQFHTKMLRWTAVSPDGKSAVFEALGHLYIRALPHGAPRRLTRDEDVFEHHPSFSRDGAFVTYATWNDEKLGSIRVASARFGRTQTVTRKPGHYVEPVFSPDGRWVVYRKLQAHATRAQTWSHDPGIYVALVTGGAPKLVTRAGHHPSFGARSDRVFFISKEGDGEKKRRLMKSIELDGSDERTHLKSKLATDFRISPDGRWLAFREQYNVYVAPFPATGQPIEIGPKSEALPLARVTRDGGEYLHFSGDSRRLHWTLGPELFTRELKDSFAFLDGAPKKPLDPPESGSDIGFDVASDVPPGTLAFVGARVVTMKKDEVIEDGIIVVERNRIAVVGPKSKVKVPKNAKIIDVSGTTIVPGFVDVHHHGYQGGHGIIPQANWAHYGLLAFGVTTVHDPSHDTATIFAASELARAGEITAPRIFSTGTILYGAQLPLKAVVENLDDARAHLRRMKAVGAFSVKSYRQRQRSQRQQIVAAARELEMMVVPEGGAIFHHNMNMVVDGHTGIEHCIPVAAVYDDVIQLWSQSKVGYTPTMTVGYGGLSGENYWYQHTNVFEHPRLSKFVPSFLIEPKRRRTMAADDDYNHFSVGRVAKKLADAGVSVQLGAHGQREGLAIHWELWMFVQGGMSPMEALRTATANGAAYLGLDGDLGSIEPGKLADLAVIEGDVLKDIRQSENVRYTVLNGRIYDAATMNQVGNHPRKRPRFFWEMD